MSDVPIPLDDVDFYDRYEPLIDAGDYTLSLSQQVAVTSGPQSLPSEPFTATQAFTVVAPRFQLPPADLAAVFPPPNASGDFSQNLPHVVLNQRALPWERPLGSTLLDYEIATTPDPIVSGSSGVELAIDVAVPTPATCSGVVITLPASLTPSTTQPTVAGGWKVSQQGSAFTLTPAAGAGTRLTLAGVAAGAAGTQLVTIAETDASGTTRSSSVPLTVVAQGSTAGPMTPNVPDHPWLAVIVLTPDEVAVPAPGGASTLSNPTLTLPYPIAEVLQPPSGTLGPALTAGKFDEASCRAFDITTATFERVMPRLEELRWLAHARQVNVTAKETSAALQDGWFSVVVANRFPAVAGAEGQRNIAHLVSLEGFAPYLVDSPTWPAGVQNVRLVSLAEWSFTSRTAPANFPDLMERLVKGESPGGDELRLRLDTPAPATQPATGSPEDLARRALCQGYVALGYDTRAGAHSYGWYHGPFVPHPVAPLGQGPPFASPAAATVYDRQTGTFDLSYAAAWEAGRLLALSDRAYTLSQARAQRAARRTLRRLSDRAGGGAGVVEDLRALIAHPDTRAALEDHARGALEDGPLSDVADWLAQLRLLRGVPFANLVPDARMLPAESIRFFYVDPNYLDALCDGAQSVLTRSSLDAAQRALVRDVVRAEAIARAGRLRADATGTPAAGEAQPGDPVAGFLLRSAAVAGWPGMEVCAYATSDGTGPPIDCKRMERLAPDVLLCLYAQVPTWIEVDEPRETLAFGVEPDQAGDDIVYLRSLDASNAGAELPDGASVTLDAQHMRDRQLRTAQGASRVLDVGGWQAALAAAAPPGVPAAWGPAGFAVEMVRAPERMVFQNRGGA